MDITIYTHYKRVEKTEKPTYQDIENGALVLYTNGHLETILGHIRFFCERKDGSHEWTAGSSDDVTDIVQCWFRKVK